MLNLGFQEEMKSIFNILKNIKKRILTSATNLNEIPEFVRIQEFSKLDFLAIKDIESSLTYYTIETEEKHKIHTIEKLMYQLKGQSLLFCNHREAVERVSESLKELNIHNVCFHGAMEQAEREESLILFRNKSSNLLICTDLASRGLDIPEIQNIIHYQFPINEESYIHRNGRTARINNLGNVFIILTGQNYLPDYIKHEIHKFEVNEIETELPITEFVTIKFNKGKKDKVNKIDIVGLLTQKGKVQKENIGLIEVKDFTAYIALKNTNINNLIKILKEEKIKNQKLRIEAIK